MYQQKMMKDIREQNSRLRKSIKYTKEKWIQNKFPAIENDIIHDRQSKRVYIYIIIIIIIIIIRFRFAPGFL